MMSSTDIRAGIRAISRRARTRRAARAAHIAAAARQAGAEWPGRRGSVPGAPTAAAHIANAVRQAVRKELT